MNKTAKVIQAIPAIVMGISVGILTATDLDPKAKIATGIFVGGIVAMWGFAERKVGYYTGVIDEMENSDTL